MEVALGTICLSSTGGKLDTLNSTDSRSKEMARVQAKMCDQSAESRQRLLYYTTAACFSLQVVVVALKFITRRYIQGCLMADDYILVAAMISPLIGSSVLFWCTYRLFISSGISC